MNKRIFWTKGLILCLLFCLFTTNVVHAQVVTTFSNLYLEISHDDDVICIEAGASTGDPRWAQAGVLDATAKKKEISKLGGSALLYDPSTRSYVILSSKTSTNSQDIFNLKDATEEAKKAFYDTMSNDGNETTSTTIEEISGGEVPFFRLHIIVTGAVCQEEIVYGTVYNGALIYFDAYEASSNGKIDETFLQQLVAGTHFTKTFTKESYDQMVRESFRRIILLFVGAIVFFIVLVFVNRKRKAKKAESKKRRADSLHEYYEKQKQTEALGTPKTLLFENHTTYTEAMIRQFCTYNNYVKRLPILILTIVLYLVLLTVMYLAAGFTIMFVIVFGLMIGLFYSQHYKIEKIGDQIWKTYANNKNKVADINFYEDTFTLSGVQYVTEYPYQQIVDIQEYKNYIYLYMSEDRAIYLAKDQFSINQDEALEFIKGKVTR